MANRADNSGKTRVAILGATGLLGRELSRLLSERFADKCSFELVASAESAGEVYEIGGGEVEIKTLEQLEGSYGVVFICLPSEKAAEAAKLFATGAKLKAEQVIDCSGASTFALADPFCGRGVQSNVRLPHPLTLQLMAAVQVLAETKVVRMVSSALVPSSTFGQTALDSTWEEFVAVLNQRSTEDSVFSEQVAFNILPQLGAIMKEPGAATSKVGESRSDLEGRIEAEFREAVWPNSEGQGFAVCAQLAPILFGLSQTVTVDLSKAMTVAEFTLKLAKSEWFELHSEFGSFPSTLRSVGEDKIQVGRFKQVTPNSIMFSMVSDNVLLAARAALKLSKLAA